MQLFILIYCNERFLKRMISYVVNPLLPGFFFRRFSGHKPEIDSFRLPTHSRYPHTKFFF